MTTPTDDPIDQLKRDPNLYQRFMTHLTNTVKHDDATKGIVFVTGISKNTINAINLFLRGPPSTGKTWISIHALQYFNQHDIYYLGGLSEKALIHQYGILIDRTTRQPIDTTQKPQRDNYTTTHEYHAATQQWNDQLANTAYLVDLDNKLILFLDAPKVDTFNALKPILSHDKPEIEYKFTDRTNKQKFRTTTVILKGWPAAIFATAKDEYNHEFVSRGFTATPEYRKDKIKAVVTYKGDKSTYPWKHKHDIELQHLKEYMDLTLTRYAIMDKPDIAIPYANILAQQWPHSESQYMRDFDHFIFIIKAFTILHLWQRPILHINNEQYILATMHDFCNAFSLWLSIAETTQTGLAGHVVELFHKVIIPLYERTGKFDMTQLVEHYHTVFERSRSSKRLYDYVKLLRDIGWVDTEPSPTDKRKNLIKVLENPKNLLISSVSSFPALFTEETFNEWISSIKNYSEKNGFYIIQNIIDHTRVYELFHNNNNKEVTHIVSEDSINSVESNDSSLSILYKNHFSRNIFSQRFHTYLKEVNQQQTSSGKTEDFGRNKPKQPVNLGDFTVKKDNVPIDLFKIPSQEPCSRCGLSPVEYEYTGDDGVNRVCENCKHHLQSEGIQFNLITSEGVE